MALNVSIFIGPEILIYSFHLHVRVPYALFWLRYSLFAVLYPTGIVSEVGLATGTAVMM